MINVSTTLFFRKSITSCNPYDPFPVFPLISLNNASTSFFSSTSLKLPKISDDFANASLIPSEPEYDESIVAMMLFCNLYSR